MIPTARCLAAKPPGFFKKSTEELSRLTRIGKSPFQLKVPSTYASLLTLIQSSVEHRSPLNTHQAV